MRLYIRMKTGETYYAEVPEEDARDVVYKISNTDGLAYLPAINMAINASEVLLIGPYEVIDRKQKVLNNV